MASFRIPRFGSTSKGKFIDRDVEVVEGISYEVRNYEGTEAGEPVQEKVIVNKAHYQPAIDKSQAEVDELTALQDKCAE